jgi:hypothetical protein
VRTTPYLAVALVRTCPREVRRLRLLLNTQGEGMPPLHRLAAARGIELEVEEAPLESAA